MVLNSVQEKQVLKNNPRGVVFVRSETGPFFVWAQPDWRISSHPELCAELCQKIEQNIIFSLDLGMSSYQRNQPSEVKATSDIAYALLLVPYALSRLTKSYTDEELRKQ